MKCLTLEKKLKRCCIECFNVSLHCFMASSLLMSSFTIHNKKCAKTTHEARFELQILMHFDSCV
jgi:hypothetical protein